jgi:hypothetical protein
MSVLASDPLRAAFTSPTSHSRAPKCACGRGRRFGTDGMGTAILVCDHCDGEQRANEAALLRVAKLFQLDVDEAARRLLIVPPPPPVTKMMPPACRGCGSEFHHEKRRGRRHVRCPSCRAVSAA